MYAQQVSDRLTRKVHVAVRQMSNTADMVRAVDVVADFDHREVPVGFDDAVEIDERERDHPICHGRWIWEERKEFELDAIEVVDWDGGFGVAVQVFV